MPFFCQYMSISVWTLCIVSGYELAQLGARTALQELNVLSHMLAKTLPHSSLLTNPTFTPWISTSVGRTVPLARVTVHGGLVDLLESGPDGEAGLSPAGFGPS